MLFIRDHINVLTGSYLSGEVDNPNSGKHRIRIMCGASLVECVNAIERLLYTTQG